MPELPEVETVRNALKLRLLNLVIESVEVLYDGIIEYPSVLEFKNNIKKQTINDINRYGKWLIFVLDDYYMLSHLRMEGKYFIKSNSDSIEKHEHVMFSLSNNTELRYRDTRKFGKMLLIPKDKLYEIGPFNKMGLEPWDKSLTSDYLLDKFKNKRIPIKTTLLAQSIIVGIGNIYADEILFKSGLNPVIRSCDLSRGDCNNIIKYTKEILEDAIRKGGTTIRSYSSVDGVHGLFQQELFVHTKSVCSVCNTKITKIVVGGRGTYYCSKCQK